ncbi:Peptidase cysteine/serine, trypsin-like protein [Metarhizium guizhouense ARSEF 977]|uniref:Peptidase cysteine/serine, trypsin-like protein n=1 Tax=Metarhizium guizhouense (strain ARSEF 977) TaxID=1276136 RepID=A0A0B4H452_METGA|nr:Peptidase cysteine/serine, trypsin-like protein [Metarhizium guizhouense ARSEF 977]
MLPKTAIALAVAFSATPARIAAATINKRIVGGQDANDGEFPFFVHIQLRARDACGGTLLDEHIVLTAAHCAQVASTSETTLNTTKYGVSSNISGVKIHPDFKKADFHRDTGRLTNDIAIVYLENGFRESNTVRYAVLAAHGSDAEPGSIAIGVGRGVTDPAHYHGAHQVERLRKVDIPVVPRAKCVHPVLGVIEDTSICAGGNGKNPCSGDSGGPLVDQATGQVIGVTSDALADADWTLCNLSPSKYIRVASYIPWINANRNASAPGPGADQKGDDSEGQAEEYCGGFGRGSDGFCLSVAAYCLQNYHRDGHLAYHQCPDAERRARKNCDSNRICLSAWRYCNVNSEKEGYERVEDCADEREEELWDQAAR